MELGNNIAKKSFTKVDDSLSIGFTEKYIYPVADGEFIVIGKYRVMFGYRLIAGYADMPDFETSSNELNICCGADKKDYDIMFEVVKNKISANPSDDPFCGIPQMSKIKPYFNDREFCDKMNITSLPRTINGASQQSRNHGRPS
jgi:hypothetical protein